MTHRVQARRSCEFSRHALLRLLGLMLGLAGTGETALGQWTQSGNDLYATPLGNIIFGGTSGGARVHFKNPGSFAVRYENTNGSIFSFVVDNPENAWQLTAGLANTSVITATSAGRVGIGTTSPATPLHVMGAAKFESGVSEALTVKSITSDVNLIFQTSAGQSGEVTANASGLQFNAPLPGDDIYFRTQGSNPVVFKSGGNVGIGTTSPTAKLHVAGDVTVDGAIAATYQDVAEWVPADRPLLAGTVVVIDPGRTDWVVPSSKPYDTSVVGVVSESPGILLGTAGEGKVKVAAAGRVKVKVDANCAPIGRGDLLVSSDEEGMAMRSEPVDIGGVTIHRPGTLIGKALEPLSSGKGEILVLLSLQ